MSKNILLKSGKFTVVDDEDFEYLNQWKWQENRDGYVFRSHYWYENGIRKQGGMYMHREVMKAAKGTELDHKNRDKLDNRKKNLRFTDRISNCRNRGVMSHNTSGISGVHWLESKKRWIVRIGDGTSKRIYIGSFRDKDLAISARKKAERQLWQIPSFQ